MNRVFVAMHDGVDEPEWFNNVEPFVLKALKEFNFDEGDKFMIIASDGIWEFISNEEAMEIGKKYYLRNKS